METRNNKLDWVDAVKALCMIGVYILHSEAYCPSSGLSYGYILSPFYVNAFFVVSGYLLFRRFMNHNKSIIINNFQNNGRGEGYKHTLKNIIFRLMIPTMLFSTLLYIPKVSFHGGALTLPQFLLEVPGGVSYWFTSALAVAQLVFLFLFLFKRRSIWFYVLISIGLFSLGLYLNGLEERTQAIDYFPWFYCTGLEYTLLMALGGLYLRYEKFMENMMKVWGTVLASVLYIGLLVYGKEISPLLMMGAGGRVNPPGILTVFCSVLLVFRVCKLLPHVRWLEYIGQNSIVFYFFSGVMPAMAGKLMVMAIPSGYGYVSTLAVAVFSLLLSTLICEAINRYAPFMLDVRKLKLWNVKN